MATVDLSRSATDFRKRFRSVRAQMGAVFTDDNQNDNERIHLEDHRRTNVDVIGPAGTPDDGFRVDLPRVDNGKINFDILPGTFYLGGYRCELDQKETFQAQTDWLPLHLGKMPAPPAAGARRDLVVLETFLHPVSSVEDGENSEKALPGVEGAAHMRLRQHVHLFSGIAGTQCQDAWTALQAGWTAAGLGTINSHNELVPNVKLEVVLDNQGGAQDLCSPSVIQGYLGAFNTAIRVELLSPTHLTWGFDNAAPLYRVQVNNDAPPNPVTKRVVVMQTEPKDQEHWPAAGQIVEILRWGSILPNGEIISDSPLANTDAQFTRFLSRVDVPYDPDTKSFRMVDPLPANFNDHNTAAAGPEFYYLRIWNRGDDTASAPSIQYNPPPNADGTTTLGNIGLKVKITGPDRREGDHWIIAARPETPGAVVPWLFQNGGRAPHGFRRFFAPLAVIEWTAGQPPKVQDCRLPFPPLTKLKSCCTYTVGDGLTTFGNFNQIQKAVDALPASGGEVCLLPGVFVENVKIVGRRNIRIHGCGARSVLRPQAKGPVIVIEDSQNIRLDHFRVEAIEVTGIFLQSTVAADDPKALDRISLEDLEIAGRDASAIECRGGRNIRILRNAIVFAELARPLDNLSDAGKLPGVFVQADDALIEWNRIEAQGVRRLVRALGGLHIGGGSERVEIRRNRILGGNGNGITLGSVSLVPGPSIGLLFNNYAAIMKISKGWFMGGGIFVDDNGCIHVDPDPRPPRDPNNPQTPVSDGDLEDILIYDNEIDDMGLNGIATLRFLSEQFGAISVTNLAIEFNRIHDNLQNELGNKAITSAMPIGFGGVSLVSVRRLTLRDNWIEENGKTHLDPVCGVFVRQGQALAMQQNRIRDNGQVRETNKIATPGPRAGIWIGLAKPDEGLPAILIQGNQVVSPLGPALVAAGKGAFLIEGNELVSQGIPPKTQLAQIDPKDKIFAAHDVLALLGGDAVRIYNSGQAGDFSTYGKFAGVGNHYVDPGYNVAVHIPAKFIVFETGGAVLFHDNQTSLAAARAEGVLINAVLLVALDDASMQDNQCEAFVGERILLSHALVFGVTARLEGNRLKEIANPLGFSAVSVGAMNCTTGNQGTRCFLAVGMPPLLVAHSNRSWPNLAGNVCDEAARALLPLFEQQGLITSAGI